MLQHTLVRKITWARTVSKATRKRSGIESTQSKRSVQQKGKYMQYHIAYCSTNSAPGSKGVWSKASFTVKKHNFTNSVS